MENTIKNAKVMAITLIVLFCFILSPNRIGPLYWLVPA